MTRRPNSDFFFKEYDNELTALLISHKYVWMAVTIIRLFTVLSSVRMSNPAVGLFYTPDPESTANEESYKCAICGKDQLGRKVPLWAQKC